MGADRLQYGIKIRKLAIISMRTCSRSVCNHPFLVGMLCFLIFLYRSFPFVFSLFISASPVLVCTAILLGTLLSFGQTNIPEIETEEKVTHDISSLKAEVAEDATVVERHESFAVERHVGMRRDIAENDIEDVALVDNRVSEVEEDAGSVHYTLLTDEKSRDIQYEKRVVEEVERVFIDSVSEKWRQIHLDKPGVEGVLSTREPEEDQHPLIDKVGEENLQVEDDKSLAESSDIRKGDQLDSSLMSSWRRMRHDDDDDHDDSGDDEDDDESMDSGSDRAESSSPDASMADIMPMLDELHPLLDLDAPQPAQLSHDGSEAASGRSHGSSNDGSIDSDADTENQGEEDNDDDEEQGGGKGDNEDGSKSAIKWTEDDQKNLMDLGSSELERNQRLENLIARRRARKNMRLMAEKNLIDLDGADLPFNVPPISTTRRNPFDLPCDSYDNLDLPPIPGSAPSILLPRKNPFDLPYDSSEEKPDLKGDSFQQEFSAFHQREAFPQREALFRRHESFNVGPSTLGGSRQEFKWKPYFVPEQLATEGASSSSFQRQLSQVSESKMSSVPDSESVSSVVDEDDKRLDEQNVSQETEIASNVDNASSHDEQESQSLEDIDSMDIEQAENRDAHQDVLEITLGDVESHQEIESNLSEAEVASHMEHDASEIHSRAEAAEEDYSSRSSVSSLSEIDEIISDVKGDGSTSSESRGQHVKESDICTQPSFEGSEFNFMSSVVDDNQHKEPVYDSSPPSIEKFLSFSSVSSDTQLEMSDVGSPPVLVGSADKEPEVNGESMAHGTSCTQELHGASLESTNETGAPPVSVHAASSVSSDTQVEMSEIGSPLLVGSAGKESELCGESVEHVTSGTKEMHEASLEAPNETALPPVLVHAASSVSCDTHVEMTEIVSPPLLVGSADKEHEHRGESVEHVSSGTQELHEASLEAPTETALAPASVHAASSVSSDTQVEMSEIVSPKVLVGSADKEPEYHGESVEHVTSCTQELHEASLEAPNGTASPPVLVHAASSVSSNSQVEMSEIGSPPVLVGSADKEPEGHGESMEHGSSGIQELHAALFEVPSEINPKAGDALEITEHDVMQVGSSASQVVAKFVDYHGSMVPETMGECALSSESGLVSEGMTNKEESFHDEQNQEDSLRRDSKMLFAVEQDMGEVFDPASEEHLPSMLLKLSSEFEHLEECAVNKKEGQLEQGEIHSSSSSDDGSVEQDIMHREETIKTEVDGIHSSSFGADIRVNGHPHISKELSFTASSYQHVSPVDLTMFVLEEQQPSSVAKQVSRAHPNLSSSEADNIEKDGRNLKMDQVQPSGMHGKIDTVLQFDREVMPSYANFHDGPSQEKSSQMLGEQEQLSMIESSFDYHDQDKDLVTESREETSTVSGVKVYEFHDSEDKTPMGFSSPTYESTSNPSESPEYKSPTAGEFIDEIVYEDCQKLSERINHPSEVNVSHFSEEDTTEEADEIKEIDEGILSELDTIGDFNVKEVDVPKETNVGDTDSAFLPKDIKVSVELPVLEARSMEDIDLAFKQLHEGVDVEEVIVPSMIEDQLSLDESKDSLDINSKLTIVEARSLNDIHIALQQASESSLDEPPKPLESKESSEKVEAYVVDSTRKGESNNAEYDLQESSSRDVVSTKEIESRKVDSYVEESSKNAAEEPKRVFRNVLLK